MALHAGSTSVAGLSNVVEQLLKKVDDQSKEISSLKELIVKEFAAAKSGKQ